MAAPFGSLEFDPEQNRYELGWETRVTNLYDLKTKRLAFINNKLGTEFRVEMNKISFDKKNPIRCLKMDNPRLIGDVTSRFLKKSCPLQ